MRFFIDSPVFAFWGFATLKDHYTQANLYLLMNLADFIRRMIVLSNKIVTILSYPGCTCIQGPNYTHIFLLQPLHLMFQGQMGLTLNEGWMWKGVIFIYPYR